MGEPSDYELNAWQEIQDYKQRPSSTLLHVTGQKVARAAELVGAGVSQFIEQHPQLNRVVDSGANLVQASSKSLAKAASKVAGVVPRGAVDWTGSAGVAIRDSLSKASRAGLSPKKVVALHKKRGHNVNNLLDVRSLDLERIDAVGKRGTGWVYHVAAAGSGVGAGLIITGGEVFVAASAGAAAAPSAAAVAGAIAGDAALVMALSSRVVGHVSMLYGFDPEVPSEKLFVLSVLNAGSAITLAGKTAAMQDVSKLTQALMRGKNWAVLQESVVAKIAKKFADQFSLNLTKDGLGKMVPAVGIVLGGAFNLATMDSIVDAANVIYRKRFLLEKYPHLATQDTATVEAGDEDIVDAEVVEEEPETISVVELIREAGGPEL